MSQLPEDLTRLADHFGIALEFRDWKHRSLEISQASVIAVLGALGVDASTPESRVAAFTELTDARWRRTLPPCTVVELGNGVSVNAHVPAGTRVEVWLELETGGRRDAHQIDNWEPDRMVDGQQRGQATFFLGHDLPLGYHRLLATGDEGTHEATVVVTPPHVGFPAAMGEARTWGYATQLYSVVSEKSWGVGDLADLADLIAFSGAEQGAGHVLINPLHAAEPTPPMEPSPYLPASRRFMNPLYIRPESIPEFTSLGRHDRSSVRRLRKQLRPVDGQARVIDRDGAWKVKQEALRLIHRAGRRPARQLALEHFVRREGQALQDFATWCALAVEFGNDWREWPAEYQEVGSPAVLEYAAVHAEEVSFHTWLQWVSGQQVSAAQTVAEEVGMPVGVMTDLAVGVSRSSAETWAMPDLFADGVTVGAPPDDYNQSGQDWGQPPWRPDKLEEVAYAPFREMVAAAMRRAGGVRIDHIIGLFRLWWVPEGLGPRHGTYVRNNHEALIGILSLEAHRAQALVVGEDLGTVEPWVRQYLSRRGILGTSVLWFENDHGRPLDAHRWREYCLASVTTHDLPPTLGYLAGDHVHLRDSLDLLTEPLQEELDAARAEQSGWLNKLVDEGVLDADLREDPEEVMLALHRYLLLTPSRVLLASLGDAVGERRTQNQPGTIDEYPNWRVPLADATGRAVTLEEIFEAELPKRLAAVMNDAEGL
ncbi:MAG: 4-alpha-glucanotransferase [Propionibacteriaceae bacterium]|nr:4-alpha-glucanotransferase [Propionibacteriaceae bacterium]